MMIYPLKKYKEELETAGRKPIPMDGHDQWILNPEWAKANHTCSNFEPADSDPINELKVRDV